MGIKYKNWVKSDKGLTEEDCFLRNLGVKNTNEINQWCIKSKNGEYTIDSIADAVDLIKKHINDGSPIHIIGDYDVDGVSASAIMYKTLMENFCFPTVTIPKRFTDGYGMKTQHLPEENSGLIITVDNGIAALSVVDNARQNGLDVLIIDHHEAPVDENGNEILPNANVIVNPKAVKGSGVFDGYCGAALAYKVASNLCEGKVLSECLTLAALATVADVMELREENYVIVRQGLSLLNKDIGPIGLMRLLQTKGLDGHLTAYQGISFGLAPILNAASRMNDEGAMDSFNLLTTEDVEIADSIIGKLLKRHELCKVAKNLSIKKGIELVDETSPVIAIYIPNIAEGVIGLVAGNFAEKYKKPTYIFSDGENGFYKGSGRAPEGYNMIENLRACHDLLSEYGGHVSAAGMSITKENFPLFQKQVVKIANEVGYTPESTDNLTYDLEIDVCQLNEVIENLSKYEPRGEGNPRTKYLVKNFTVNDLKPMGDNKTMFRFVSDNATAVAFDLPEVNGLTIKEMNIIGYPTENHFNGRVYNQIEIIDIAPM